MSKSLKRYRLFRAAAAILCHAWIVCAALVLAVLLRFDLLIPPDHARILPFALALVLVTKMTLFRMGGFDDIGWRYLSVFHALRIYLVNLLASAVFAVVGIVCLHGFARSIYVIDFILCFLFTVGVRVAARIHFEGLRLEHGTAGEKAILIYGAEDTTAALLREIRQNPALKLHVAGILVDDESKLRLNFMGTRVIGRGRDAAAVVERLRRRGVNVEEIVISMAAASGREMTEALANCRAAGVACRTVPGVGELLTQRVLTSQLRPVSLSDLLGREPVQLDRELIEASLHGRAVLVTGAAGSIGSEICRQIARYAPRTLVAFDRAESDLFHVELEMRGRFPGLAFVPRIGDIREYESVQNVIREFCVETIFHAAAYKHVPLMECHAVEAVRNNVFGTRVLVEAAQRCGVGTFLMISSDKAVNPTNVMGATKRVAELIVSSQAVPLDGSGTRFISVRFGNVLGSNGSVIPVFQKQIEAGGPVTVTHPAMKRYFMTIPEAVELVLQASTMGHGSEVYVLDMGEPVRIVELARNMIRLSGKEPGVDIEIRFIGQRPGEKLFEELSLEGERFRPTRHQKIWEFDGTPVRHSDLQQGLAALEQAARNRDELGAVRGLRGLVPEFVPESFPEVLAAESLAMAVRA